MTYNERPTPYRSTPDQAMKILNSRYPAAINGLPSPRPPQSSQSIILPSPHSHSPVIVATGAAPLPLPRSNSLTLRLERPLATLTAQSGDLEGFSLGDRAHLLRTIALVVVRVESVPAVVEIAPAFVVAEAEVVAGFGAHF